MGGKIPSATTSAQCSAAAIIPPVSTSNVSGTITQSGAPVSGAAVSCTGASATSQTDGSYNLIGCIPNANAVISAQSGTSTGSTTISLNGGVQVTGINIAISAPSTTSLTIITKDDSGNLLNSQIGVSATGYSNTTNNVNTITYANVPQGTVTISAMATVAGYLTNTTIIQLTAPTTITLTLPKTNITITPPITGGGTAPSAATTVITVVEKGTTKVVKSADVKVLPTPLDQYTDNTGKVSFGLTSGVQYTLMISHSDYETGILPIVGGTATYTAELTPIQIANLHGCVVDSSTKNKISGVTIYSDGATATTDFTGCFNNLKIKKKVPVAVISLSFAGYANKMVSQSIPASNDVDFGNIEMSKNVCDLSASITLSGTQVGNKTSLIWNVPCSDIATDVTVFKQEGAGLFQPASSGKIISSYVDSDVQGDTSYSYFVNITYNAGLVPLTKQSNAISVVMGMKECLNQDMKFCSGNDIVVCSNGQGTVNPCPGASTCFEDSPTQARCINASRCAQCNRPFGVFAFPKQVGVTAFGGKGFNVSIGSFTAAGNQGLFFCSDQADCYLDYSSTIVDKYMSCALPDGTRVTSCYDYLSQSACSANTCLKSLGTNGCEWISSNYSELGIGLCRPRDEAKQDCIEFDIRKGSNLNKVFSNAKAACLMFGDCYYSVNGAVSTCMNKRDVSCYDYHNNKADCVGATNPQNVSVNVTWYAAPAGGISTYKKNSGDNAIIQNSTDLIGRNVCAFIDDRGICLRDSDNNEQYPVNSLVDFDQGAGPSDCALDSDGNPIDASCALDVTPPKTTVDATDFMSTTELQNMHYNIVDSSDITEAKAYFTMVPTLDLPFLSSSDTYPKDPLPTVPSSDGNYSLFYFSEDASHNLEQVKRADVVVDNVQPQITFTKTAIPSTDLASNELTFIPTLLLTGNDDLAFCLDKDASGMNTGLYKKDIPTGDAFISPTQSTLSDQVPASSWSQLYENLSSGNYSYSWYCCDRANNCIPGRNDNLKLDADMLISNPQPENAVRDRTNIPISIDSMFPGECRYCDDSTSCANWDSWNSFTESSDRLHHASTVNVPTKEHTRYLVGCNMTDIQGIIYGKSEDNIAITIDDKPPVTQVFESTTGTDLTFENTYWVRASNLQLVCNDTAQRLGGYPSEIGCGNVTYCLGSKCSESTGTTAIPTINETATMTYSSQDALGNRETQKSSTVKFDNVAPTLIITSPNISSGTTVRTRAKEFVLSGQVLNSGAAAGTASPLKLGGTYYTLLSNGIVKRTNLAQVDRLAGQETVNFIEQGVRLGENQDNILRVYTTDLAGNTFAASPITISQDSLGPNLTLASFRRIPDVGPETDNLDIEYGSNLNIVVRGLTDKTGVDSVWVQDVFRTKYPMHFDSSRNGWIGTVMTEKWPVITTTLNVFANDTLGNVANRSMNFSVFDDIPPSADISLENKYGEKQDTLIKGMNYVVLNASEALTNVSLSFIVQDKQYNVTFAAKDFNSITWVGFTNVNDEILSTAQVSGIMYDLNGIQGNVFSPGTFNIASSAIPEPLVSGITAFTNGVYYINSTNPAYALNTNYNYQFNVKGRISTFPSGTQIANVYLNTGSNDVQIRVEDSRNNYVIFNQKVNNQAQGMNASVPVVSVLNINSSNLNYFGFAQIINGQLTSKEEAIPLAGPMTYANIGSVYVIGQDAKKYDASVSGLTFSINSIKLVGRTFEETQNNLVLTFQDNNGNQFTKTISIVKDLKPPYLKNLLFANFTIG